MAFTEPEIVLERLKGIMYQFRDRTVFMGWAGNVPEHSLRGAGEEFTKEESHRSTCCEAKGDGSSGDWGRGRWATAS